MRVLSYYHSIERKEMRGKKERGRQGKTPKKRKTTRNAQKERKRYGRICFLASSSTCCGRVEINESHRERRKKNLEKKKKGKGEALSPE